jgi:flagellar protein FliO/FliZ
VDTVTMVGRLLVSLAAVLGVMWLLARRLRKGGRMKDTRLIDVLGRQQLSRNASVAVVRVGEQALVIGVTDAAVSVLGETDLGTAQAMVAAASSTPLPAKTARTAQRVIQRADNPRGEQPDEQPLAVRPRRSGGRHAGGDPDAPKRAALAGSALSPQTWRQTVESLRDLTSRST